MSMLLRAAQFDISFIFALTCLAKNAYRKNAFYYVENTNYIFCVLDRTLGLPCGKWKLKNKLAQMTAPDLI